MIKNVLFVSLVLLTGCVVGPARMGSLDSLLVVNKCSTDIVVLDSRKNIPVKIEAVCSNQKIIFVRRLRTTFGAFRTAKNSKWVIQLPVVQPVIVVKKPSVAQQQQQQVIINNYITLPAEPKEKE
jgi:hypothetical protein